MSSIKSGLGNVPTVGAQPPDTNRAQEGTKGVDSAEVSVVNVPGWGVINGTGCTGATHVHLCREGPSLHSDAPAWSPS